MKKISYNVPRGNQTLSVTGYAHPCGLAARQISPENWQIDHVKSGLRVDNNLFRLRRDAKKAIEALARLADWTLNDTELLNIPTLRSDVRRVLCELDD